MNFIIMAGHDLIEKRASVLHKQSIVSSEIGL